eukprot:g7940.t1
MTSLASLLQDGMRVARATAQVLERPSRSARGTVERLFPQKTQFVNQQARRVEESFSMQEFNATMREATDTANEALHVLDVNLRVLGPQDPNWVKEEQPAFTREQARRFVALMAEAKTKRLGDVMLEKYIDNLLSDAKFKRIVHMTGPGGDPEEPAQISLTTLRSVSFLPPLRGARHMLRVENVQLSFKHLEYGEDEQTVTPLQPWTVLNQRRVERVMKRVIRERESTLKYIKKRYKSEDRGLPPEALTEPFLAGESPAEQTRKNLNVFSNIEGDFIVTISQIVMRLMSDMFCDQRIKVRILGHELKWFCEPMIKG